MRFDVDVTVEHRRLTSQVMDDSWMDGCPRLRYPVVILRTINAQSLLPSPSLLAISLASVLNRAVVVSVIHTRIDMIAQCKQVLGKRK